MLYNLLLLFCLYLPFQLALNVFEGVDLASGRVFVLILGILWLFKSLAQKRLFIPNKIQTLLLFSFLFLSAFSLVFSQNTDWAYRKLLFLLSFVPLYFIVFNVASNQKYSKKIIEFLTYGAGLISLVGLAQFSLQFFIGIDETLRLWQTVISPFLGNSFSKAVFEYQSWLVGISGNTYMRSIAFFPDPHMFSFFLGMILPWNITLIFKSEDTFKKYIFFITSVLIFSVDILTFSRGGYLGMFAGLIFTFFIFRKSLIQKFSLKKIAAFSIFSLIILGAIFIPNPISQRLGSSFSLDEGSNEGRLKNWNESLNIIGNNPLGVGIGNYSLEVKPDTEYREPIYAHNLYFDIAAETGIINALFFIWLLIASILNFIKLGKSDNFYLAGSISLVIFSVHSIFETPLYSIHILPLLLITFSLSVLKDA